MIKRLLLLLASLPLLWLIYAEVQATWRHFHSLQAQPDRVSGLKAIEDKLAQQQTQAQTARQHLHAVGAPFLEYRGTMDDVWNFLKAHDEKEFQEFIQASKLKTLFRNFLDERARRQEMEIRLETLANSLLASEREFLKALKDYKDLKFKDEGKILDYQSRLDEKRLARKAEQQEAAFQAKLTNWPAVREGALRPFRDPLKDLREEFEAFVREYSRPELAKRQAWAQNEKVRWARLHFLLDLLDGTQEKLADLPALDAYLAKDERVPAYDRHVRKVARDIVLAVLDGRLDYDDKVGWQYGADRKGVTDLGGVKITLPGDPPRLLKDHPELQFHKDLNAQTTRREVTAAAGDVAKIMPTEKSKAARAYNEGLRELRERQTLTPAEIRAVCKQCEDNYLPAQFPAAWQKLRELREVSDRCPVLWKADGLTRP